MKTEIAALLAGLDASSMNKDDLEKKISEVLAPLMLAEGAEDTPTADASFPSAEAPGPSVAPPPTGTTAAPTTISPEKSANPLPSAPVRRGVKREPNKDALEGN